MIGKLLACTLCELFACFAFLAMLNHYTDEEYGKSIICMVMFVIFSVVSGIVCAI
jgi:hypothetical protein